MPTKAELEAEVAQLREQYGTEDTIQNGTTPDPWEMLSRPFDPKAVRKHPHSNFHYLSIDTMMNRLDEVLGPNWTLAVQTVSCAPVDPDWKTYGKANKTGFLASVTVRISALINGGPPPIHTVRDGVGADFADDPDKAIKTALANAIKKAANGFGVGRYLWDAEERAAIDEAQAAGNDTRQLKKAVAALYRSTLADEGEGSPAQLFDAMSPADKLEQLSLYFKVPKEDLASAETLNKILEGHTNV
jgi:hypothetical protein